MTTIKVGEQTLDYIEYSQGQTPVIFIHGIVCNHHTWLDFPRQFTGYGRVISLTLPGHYPARFPADLPQETITDAWVGDTMAAAIEQITGGEPALLIGHSTGGYAALATAWRAPRLVRQVVSLAGFARGDWTGTLGLSQRYQKLGWPGDRLFDAQLGLAASNPKIIETTWKQSAYDKAGFEASRFRQMIPKIIENNRQLDIAAMRKWFYQMYRVADLTPYLKEVKAPVLALAGRQDSFVPYTQAPHIANHVYNGIFKVFEGMDHATFIEQPERVRAAIVEWLESPLYSPVTTEANRVVADQAAV